MSVTVSNPHGICNDASNTSPSKQLWSFNKQKRFRVNAAYTNNLIYEKKSDFNKASQNAGTKRTSFGTAPRNHLFINKEIVGKPSPNAYAIGSKFKPLIYAFEKSSA